VAVCPALHLGVRRGDDGPPRDDGLVRRGRRCDATVRGRAHWSVVDSAGDRDHALRGEPSCAPALAEEKVDRALRDGAGRGRELSLCALGDDGASRRFAGPHRRARPAGRRARMVPGALARHLGPRPPRAEVQLPLATPTSPRLVALLRRRRRGRRLARARSLQSPRMIWAPAMTP